MNKPQAAFFAVIPGSVRYDEKLPHGAKLLYGEITALCNKEGYCWAGNEYFANLYQVNEKTIRNWIGKLRESGHIKVIFNYVPGKKEIQSRYIYLGKADSVQNIDLNVPKEPEVGKISSPRMEKNCHTSGKNLPEVGKISSKGMEKICRDNNTCNNTNTTTITPHTQETDLDSLSTVEKVVAAHISAKELKDSLAVLDNRLYFSQDFYQKAADFMFKNKLDLKYISWLHDYCVSRKPDSFKSYYFSVFCEDNLADEYKASLQPVSKPKPPVQPVICPACGAAHVRDDNSCPSCGLPDNPMPDDILLYRELHDFSPEKRNEYLSREENICDELSGDYITKNAMIIALKQEYGLTVVT